MDALEQSSSGSPLGRMTAFRGRCRSAAVPTPSGQLNYVVAGHGDQAVLVLPGAVGTSDSVFPVVEALSSTYRAIAPTYAIAEGMNEMCGSLTAVMDAEGVRQAIVVGSSFGGVVAQCLARRAPSRVRALVLAHAFVPRADDAWKFRLAHLVLRMLPAGAIHGLLRRRVNNVIVRPLQEAGHQDLDMWRAYFEGSGTALFSPDALLAQQRCLRDAAIGSDLTRPLSAALASRVLILQSDNDPVIRDKDRRALVARYPGAAVHTFAGTGHITPLLATDAYIAVIREFLSR